MDLVKKWGLLLAMSGFLGAQAVDDPVMKARQQRSQAQGIAEADLPPVPKGVTEPPALPPPEVHVKDSPHPPPVKQAKRRGGKLRGGKAAREVAAVEPADPPVRRGKAVPADPPVRRGKALPAEAPVKRPKTAPRGRRGKAAAAAPAVPNKPGKRAQPAGKVTRRPTKRGKA